MPAWALDSHRDGRLVIPVHQLRQVAAVATTLGGSGVNRRAADEAQNLELGRVRADPRPAALFERCDHEIDVVQYALLFRHARPLAPMKPIEWASSTSTIAPAALATRTISFSGATSPSIE